MLLKILQSDAFKKMYLIMNIKTGPQYSSLFKGRSPKKTNIVLIYSPSSGY